MEAISEFYRLSSTKQDFSPFQVVRAETLTRFHLPVVLRQIFEAANSHPNSLLTLIFQPQIY